jgi:cytochrome P450
LGFLREVTLRYGSVIPFRMAGRRLFLVNRPDLAGHVLRSNAGNYRKGIGLIESTPFLGNGLLTSEDEDWGERRRLLEPLFQSHYMTGFDTAIVAETVAMLERWRRQGPVRGPFDLAQEMMRLTLDILGRTFFGADFTASAGVVGPALTEAIEQAIRRMVAVVRLPLRVPTPSNRRYLRAVAILDRFVRQLIDERSGSSASGMDLLSLLLRARDGQADSRVSDRQLRDEVMTMLLAGHESNASALTWTFHLLSQHPEIETRLRGEIAEILDGRPPTAEDLPRLRYTKMVLLEAMRLYPPIWLIPRQAIGDDRLDGWSLPAGSHVLISPYILHRHPDCWERPEVFDPSRFAEDRSATRPPFAYLPFGAGPRACVGTRFALMEAQLILALVVSRYRLTAVPARRVEPDPLLALRVRKGLLMSAVELGERGTGQ